MHANGEEIALVQNASAMLSSASRQLLTDARHRSTLLACESGRDSAIHGASF
jgi:hypothetical protein